MRNSSILRFAREVMGESYVLGIDEVVSAFGINPPKWELDALREIPFSQKIIEEKSVNHVLVAIFPISIVDMERIADKRNERVFYNRSWEERWYDHWWYTGRGKQVFTDYWFAHHPGRTGWHLIRRKDPRIYFLWKSLDPQIALLSEDEIVPSARELIYTTIAYRLYKRMGFLFDQHYLRTSSLVSGLEPAKGQNHVIVGIEYPYGVHIVSHWDGCDYYDFGLATEVRPRSSD